MRKQVKWFADEMEKTLQKNDHKGDWNKCDMTYLRQRLNEEAGELCAAIVKGESAERIIREATDVANFAMMIADKMTTAGK